MNPASAWADEANRRMHNAQIETKRAERTTARAMRSVDSLRATLAMERARVQDAIVQLQNLNSLYQSSMGRGLVMSPGFLEMHISAVCDALGGAK